MLNHTRLPLAAILVIAALTACSSGTGSASEPGDPAAGRETTTNAATAGSDCLLGSWSADLDDLGAQLAEHQESHGLITAVTVDAGGAVQLDVEPETMSYITSAVMTLTGQTPDGVAMQMVQTHAGTSAGSWAYAEGATGAVEFTDWDGGVTIDTAITIEGETVDVPMELPADAFGTGPMTFRCTGDTMTSTAAVSPFTTTYHRR